MSDWSLVLYYLLGFGIGQIIVLVVLIWMLFNKPKSTLENLKQKLYNHESEDGL